MRNNNNSRRMRPRNNNGRNNSNNGNNGNNGNNNHKRINPKVQTFDSNGPDVRVRGTAYQISDKYLSLAKDASSVGDIILAESYLQHAEHYQRFINEMTERYEQFNQNRNQYQRENNSDNSDNSDEVEDGESSENDMEDLDQAFLVGDSRNGVAKHEDQVVPEIVVIENKAEVKVDVVEESASDDVSTQKRKKIVLPRKPRAVEA